MSLSPDSFNARPTLDLLESRDVATIGLLGGLFHGVNLFDCKPEPVKPCVAVAPPKCDIKVELPKCDVKVELPKCESPKQDKCDDVKPPVTPPKCDDKGDRGGKKDDCTPKAPPVVCEPKKDDKCDDKKDDKDCGPKAPPVVVCPPKHEDKKCDDKKDDKKDCFTPADLVCKIVNVKAKVIGFKLFGKC